MYGHTSWQRKRAPVAKKGEPKWRAGMKKSVKRIHEKYYVREALRYYRCCTLNNKGPDACPGNSIRADALEAAVQDTLFDLRLKPERLRELETKEIAQRRGEVPRLKAEVTRLERQLTELDAREQRVMKAYESSAYSAKDMQGRRAAIRTERDQQEMALDAARTGLSEAERDMVDVERMVEALTTAYDVDESLGLEERRTLMRDLIDHVAADRAGGIIVLKTTFAGIAQELFEAGTVEKQFVVGGSTRVPWKPLKDIRLEERGSTLVRGQMVTHLSSNLSRGNSTIAVPFTVSPVSAYPKELKTLGDHIRKKRLDLGLLQQDVARQLGIDENSVCNWETGRRHPKPYFIPRVIEFLGYVPWQPPDNFGKWLVMTRRANGLSRKRLAKQLSVDESTVFRWESERGHPGSRLLARLRTRFSVEEIRVVLQARSQGEFSG